MKIYKDSKWQDYKFNVSAPAFSGASSTVAGAKGLVPAPGAGEQDKFLRADGAWTAVASSQTLTATDDGDGNVTLVLS